MQHKVTKLEAGVRQLSEAIRHFFEDGDAVAIHTLASASLEVLSGIAERRGAVGMLMNNPEIEQAKLNDFPPEFREAQNFFKHGKNDASATLDFNSEQTQYTLFDAVLLANQLDKRFCPERHVYLVWFLKMYPDVLKKDPSSTSLLLAIKGINESPQRYRAFRNAIGTLRV